MDLKGSSKFQLIVLGVLIVAVVAAIGVFALSKSAGTSGVANVTIWGTFPEETMNTFFRRPEISAAFSAEKINVKYVEKAANIFDQSVVEAVSSGKGPDVVLISQDAAVQYLDKTVQIPYKSFSQRAFKDSFIQEAELFLQPNGIEALPFVVDPMVMYWNRTLLTNAGIPNPPTLWSQLYNLDGVIAKINKVDVNHNILKTGVALGTYTNISHAKDIISLLMFQAGNPIVSIDTNGSIRSVLATANVVDAQSSANAAISFYTQFADPSKKVYSWNSSLPLSRDAFTAGDLALYFGYASELNNLYARNPNLNFDVAPMPQSQTSAANITYGKVYGLAILKNASSVVGAARATMLLSSSEVQNIWSEVSGYTPVTRDLLAQKPESPFMSIFYTASLQSRGWLDPNRSATDIIFRDMVGSILSGDKRPEGAVQDSHENLAKVLNTLSN